MRKLWDGIQQMWKSIKAVETLLSWVNVNPQQFDQSASGNGMSFAYINLRCAFWFKRSTAATVSHYMPNKFYVVTGCSKKLLSSFYFCVFSCNFKLDIVYHHMSHGIVTLLCTTVA